MILPGYLAYNGENLTRKIPTLRVKERGKEMSAKKRRFCRNTVSGQRRGSKWPEEIRTAAICDLIVSNNICAVARKYQVPESTLRTWMKAAEKSGRQGKTNLFEEARRNALRRLNHNASAGAVASVDYIRRRLEVNDRDAEIYEASKAALDQLQQEGQVGEYVKEAALRLTSRMELHKPMSDMSAANYMRALQSVSEKTGRLIDEQDETALEDRNRVTVSFAGKGTGEELWQ